MMDLFPIEKSHLQELKVNKAKKIDNRHLIFNIISHIPGIRYRELLRITKFNNGTLSYHLLTLEKNLMIKVPTTREGQYNSVLSLFNSCRRSIDTWIFKNKNIKTNTDASP